VNALVITALSPRIATSTTAFNRKSATGYQDDTISTAGGLAPKLAGPGAAAPG
jgi:hypothetical protein